MTGPEHGGGAAQPSGRPGQWLAQPGGRADAGDAAVQSELPFQAEVSPLGPTSPTGHARVDAAITALDEVASLAARDRVAAYTAAHQVLHETLRTIEER
jgi:hypothetical protein